MTKLNVRKNIIEVIVINNDTRNYKCIDNEINWCEQYCQFNWQYTATYHQHGNYYSVFKFNNIEDACFFKLAWCS